MGFGKTSDVGGGSGHDQLVTRKDRHVPTP